MTHKEFVHDSIARSNKERFEPVYNIISIALSTLCNGGDDVQCPLLTLGITPPQAKCPLRNSLCGTVSVDDWKEYMRHNEHIDD